MNFKALIIVLSVCAIITVRISSQPPQEITLTVSSDGPTKEDATKNALRNAIEQAYGAFVSANTTILNDELVKDEIVTVSNGSLKDYKEISVVQSDNGNHFVTLTATVSLPNLITYAKSHGSECEFAGNTFGMEMKMFELQKENERKVLENLLKQLEILIPATMTWTMDISEPVVSGNYYEINANINWLDANYEDYKHRLASANLPEEAIEWPSDYRDIWKKYKKQYNGDIQKFRSDVNLAKLIQYDKEKGVKYFNEFTRFIYDNLSAISLTDDDNKVWKQRGLETGIIECNNIYVPQKTNSEGYSDVSYENYIEHTYYILRSKENAKFFKSELDKLVGKCYTNFVIKDNTGQVSDPMMPSYTEFQDYNHPRSKIKGSGLFQAGYKFEYNAYYIYNLGLGGDYPRWIVNITFMIPKEDIGKYSNFRIESKQ